VPFFFFFPTALVEIARREDGHHGVAGSTRRCFERHEA
jgi:hypothetical protein